MLPALLAWQQVMSGPERPSRTDVSLDPATVRQFNARLRSHPGTCRRVAE
jgi:hypothetical protein